MKWNKIKIISVFKNIIHGKYHTACTDNLSWVPFSLKNNEVKIKYIFYLLYFVHHIKSPEVFGIAPSGQILTYLRAGGGQFAAVGVHYGNWRMQLL